MNKAPFLRSSRFLIFIGHTLVLALIFGMLISILILSKLLKIFEIPWILDSDINLGLTSFFTGYTVFISWVFMTNKWKKWALKTVDQRDKYKLIHVLENEKESVVMKPWGELSKKRMLFRASVLSLLLIVCIGIDIRRIRENSLYDKEGLQTTTTLISVEKKSKGKRNHLIVKYEYSVDDSIYKQERSLLRGFRVNQREKNGFELKPGDQFELVYLPTEPTKNRITFLEPSSKTKAGYRVETIESLLNQKKDSAFCYCLMNAVDTSLGVKGLAILTNYKINMFENGTYNHLKFLWMANQSWYNSAVNNCLESGVNKPNSNPE